MRDPGKDIIVSLAEANFWTLRTPESGNMMKRVTHKNIRQVSQRRNSEDLWKNKRVSGKVT